MRTPLIALLLFSFITAPYHAYLSTNASVADASSFSAENQNQTNAESTAKQSALEAMPFSQKMEARLGFNTNFEIDLWRSLLIQNPQAAREVLNDHFTRVSALWNPETFSESPKYKTAAGEGLSPEAAKNIASKSTELILEAYEKMAAEIAQVEKNGKPQAAVDSKSTKPANEQKPAEPVVASAAAATNNTQNSSSRALVVVNTSQSQNGAAGTQNEKASSQIKISLLNESVLEQRLGMSKSEVESWRRRSVTDPAFADFEIRERYERVSKEWRPQIFPQSETFQKLTSGINGMSTADARNLAEENIRALVEAKNVLTRTDSRTEYFNRVGFDPASARSANETSSPGRSSTGTTFRSQGPGGENLQIAFQKSKRLMTVNQMAAAAGRMAVSFPPEYLRFLIPLGAVAAAACLADYYANPVCMQNYFENALDPLMMVSMMAFFAAAGPIGRMVEAGRFGKGMIPHAGLVMVAAGTIAMELTTMFGENAKLLSLCTKGRISGSPTSEQRQACEAAKNISMIEGGLYLTPVVSGLLLTLMAYTKVRSTVSNGLRHRWKVVRNLKESNAAATSVAKTAARAEIAGLLEFTGSTAGKKAITIGVRSITFVPAVRAITVAASVTEAALVMGALSWTIPESKRIFSEFRYGLIPIDDILRSAIDFEAVHAVENKISMWTTGIEYEPKKRYGSTVPKAEAAVEKMIDNGVQSKFDAFISPKEITGIFDHYQTVRSTWRSEQLAEFVAAYKSWSTYFGSYNAGLLGSKEFYGFFTRHSKLLKDSPGDVKPGDLDHNRVRSQLYEGVNTQTRELAERNMPPFIGGLLSDKDMFNGFLASAACGKKPELASEMRWGEALRFNPPRIATDDLSAKICGKGFDAYHADQIPWSSTTNSVGRNETDPKTGVLTRNDKVGLYELLLRNIRPEFLEIPTEPNEKLNKFYAEMREDENEKSPEERRLEAATYNSLNEEYRMGPNEFNSWWEKTFQDQTEAVYGLAKLNYFESVVPRFIEAMTDRSVMGCSTESMSGLEQYARTAWSVFVTTKSDQKCVDGIEGYKGNSRGVLMNVRDELLVYQKQIGKIAEGRPNYNGVVKKMADVIEAFDQHDASIRAFTRVWMQAKAKMTLEERQKLFDSTKDLQDKIYDEETGTLTKLLVATTELNVEAIGIRKSEEYQKMLTSVTAEENLGQNPAQRPRSQEELAVILKANSDVTVPFMITMAAAQKVSRLAGYMNDLSIGLNPHFLR